MYMYIKIAHYCKFTKIKNKEKVPKKSSNWY